MDILFLKDINTMTNVHIFKLIIILVTIINIKTIEITNKQLIERV